MKKKNTTQKDTDLLHRLSRIQGQIEGLKRALVESDDCLKTMGQVKAVHSAVKRFGEAYVKTSIERCATGEEVSQGFKKNIHTMVSSAFIL